MKKILFTLVAILATSFAFANAANNEPAENAARQFGFYIGHNDAVKAELMVANPELLPAYMTTLHSEIDAHGGFQTVKVLSSNDVNNTSATVTIAFICKEGEYQVEQTLTMTLNDAQQWQVTLK